MIPGLPRRRWLALVLCAAAWLAPWEVAADDGPEIVLGGQIVHGLWSESKPTVAEFRGIPFAQPPVGELRWRAPRPLLAGTGAPQFDATEFAPACMQGNGGVDWYVRVAAAFGQNSDVVQGPKATSEDCLYLNVWSPQPDPHASLPVMVFVHGGSNSTGWSYEPNYRGAALAARGLVVVTLAYRLGPLGFFAHPALDNGPGQAVTNFGLLDLRAAFEWLRWNAPAFGGNPENITAFGESAGALDLVDLLLADLAEGPARPLSFRRLVVQSIGGSLDHRRTLAQEQAAGQGLAVAAGLGPEATAADLRALPAVRWIAAAGNREGYAPADVVDGLTMKMAPIDALDQLSADGVELVIGTNADEWLMYVGTGAGEADLDAWIASHGRQPGLRAAVAGLDDPRRALDRLETFDRMVCPSRVLADWTNHTGGSAWVYRFTRLRPGPGGEALGAYHGAELPYVFDTHDAWLPTTAADRMLTESVSGYWRNFAAAGDPNGPGLPYWPPYADGGESVLELGASIRTVAPDLPALCTLVGPRVARW